MRGRKFFSVALMLIFSICCLPATGLGQTNRTLKGTVTLETSGKAVHNVAVTIIQLKRAAETDDNGQYEFQNVPPSTYDVVAHLDRVPDVVQTVQVTGGNVVTADFQIRLRAVGEQINVTASGEGQTSFNSIQSVTSLTAVELAEKNPQSLGDHLTTSLAWRSARSDLARRDPS